MQNDWIRRHDFSERGEGYDRAQVDDHLRYVAEVADSLQGETSQAGSAGSLAAARIKPIIDAAERDATACKEQAHKLAADIRKSAAANAEATLVSAQAQAQRRRQTVQDSLARQVDRSKRPAAEARRRAEKAFDRLSELRVEIPNSADFVEAAANDMSELRAALEATEAQVKRLADELGLSAMQSDQKSTGPGS